jgi:hypothetical protein
LSGRAQTTQHHQIPLNEDGIPVFPHIEAADATLKQLVEVIEAFIVAVWSTFILINYLRALIVCSSDYSWPPDKDMPSIPWDNLSSHPDVYYDTSAFSLPTRLALPQIYLTSPPDVYALLGYFTKSPRPFVFWPKSEIMQRSTAQVEKEELTRAAGDEVDEEPLVLPQHSSNGASTSTMAEAPPNSVEPPRTIAHSSDSIQPPDSAISRLEIPIQPPATSAVPPLPTEQSPSTATADAATNNAPGVAPGKKRGAHAKARRGGKAPPGESRKPSRKRDKPDTESTEIVAQSGSSSKKRKKG